MKLAYKGERFTDTAICIGNFDGVHIAHKKLIEKAVAENAKSVVYTFNPHPLKVLGREHLSVATEEDRRNLIADLGADVLYVEDCTKEFLAKDCEDFVKSILVEQFGVKKVFVGYDFTFGKNGLGNGEYLKEAGQRFGFDVYIMPELKTGDVSVSSSMVREAVKKGNFKQANAILGRAHFYSGKVEHCKGLGKTIGFPTANIYPAEDLVLPPFGVYAVKVRLDDMLLPAVCNVGINPTVEYGKTPKMETHIFNFDKDIYGERIEIEFYGMIREEKKFSSFEELKENIEKDLNNAKKYLTNMCKL